MRTLATVLGLALAAGAFPAAASAGERKDRGAVVSAAPGTVPARGDAPRIGSEVEARQYEARQAQAPEAQEFVGGEASLLVVLLIVLLVLIIL